MPCFICRIDPSITSAIWPVTCNHQLEAFSTHTHNVFPLSSLCQSSGSQFFLSHSLSLALALTHSLSHIHTHVTSPSNIVLCMREDWLYTWVGLVPARCVLKQPRSTSDLWEPSEDKQEKAAFVEAVFLFLTEKTGNDVPVSESCHVPLQNSLGLWVTGMSSWCFL